MSVLNRMPVLGALFFISSILCSTQNINPHLEPPCKRFFQTSSLHKELQSFENAYKQCIYSRYQLKVSYCHFYENDGLWFAHVEIQSEEKLTKQIADYLIVKTTEDFLDLLSQSKALHPFLRVFPPSLYHVRITINGPDIPGYIREVHAWQNQVRYEDQSGTVNSTYSSVFHKVFPEYSSNYLFSYCDCLQEALLEEVQDEDSEYWQGLKRYWTAQGFKVLENSWSYKKRFHIPDHIHALYLWLELKAEPELLHILKNHDYKSLHTMFQGIWLEWKSWLIDNGYIQDRASVELGKKLQLVCVLRDEQGKENSFVNYPSIKIMNIDDLLFISLQDEKEQKLVQVNLFEADEQKRELSEWKDRYENLKFHN